jgi:hypothetical protein
MLVAHSQRHVCLLSFTPDTQGRCMSHASAARAAATLGMTRQEPQRRESPGAERECGCARLLLLRGCGVFDACGR